MKHAEINEVIEKLGGERRVYRYFKDQYCLHQLEYEMQKRQVASLSIKELKNSAYGSYLDKPLFKANASLFGDGRIKQRDLHLMQDVSPQNYVLDFSSWGESDRGWDQTSRNQCNLVLRLNFNASVKRQYEKLVKPTSQEGPFESWCHPVSRGARKTLSWVRIDIDLQTGEALIEEIQNDWLRNAKSFLRYLNRRLAKEPNAKPSKFCRYVEGSMKDIDLYVNKVLAPYHALWAEASMNAAIQIVRQDLGIHKIYYHTFETGNKIKKVSGKPPRSMYTRLPKQFGFWCGRCFV